MLKIKKKKKKGKKDKEDDLFDPENLAKFKKELEESKRQEAEAGNLGTTSSASNETKTTEDEEWQRFKLLTAGIDVTLKKTSGDLDRIKTTSYFQKKVAATVVEEKKEQWANLEDETTPVEDFNFKEPPSHHPTPGESQTTVWPESQTSTTSQVFPPELPQPILKFEPQEQEIVILDDGLFDTSYLDAIESGEIQLAYIPESPVEEVAGDDPFDTSSVDEVVRKIQEEQVKESRKINLGSAVDYLTQEKIVVPTTKSEAYSDVTSELKKTRRGRPVRVDLFGFDEDDDSPKVDLQPKSLEITPLVKDPQQDLKDLLEEFEQGAITASASGKQISNLDLLTEPEIVSSNEQSISNEDDAWFRTDGIGEDVVDLKPIESSNENVDPFDTSVVEKLGFGRAELKLLENELLPIVDIKESISVSIVPIVTSISPILSIPVVATQEIVNNEKDDFELDPRKYEPPSIHPLEFLDSGEECAQLDVTLLPTTIEEEIDPFDTSRISHIALLGKSELRLLEDEFISKTGNASSGELSTLQTDKSNVPILSDHPLDAPDECIIDVLDLYPPITSQSSLPQVLSEFEDPFDTSDVVDAFAPGRNELKQLESELLSTTEDYVPVRVCPLRHFKVTQSSVTSAVVQPVPGRQDSLHPFDSIDIETQHNPQHRPLSPLLLASTDTCFEDPFDTSTVNEILPGKIEAKLLEEELAAFRPSISTQQPTLLEKTQNTFSQPPNIPIATPTLPSQNSEETKDPFDTSIADSFVS